MSYWQLERSQTLAAPLKRQLTPLLADERVVAAILQAGAEEDEPRRLALFLAQSEPENELAVDTLPEQEDDGPLVVAYHDQEALAQAEPDQLYLYRGCCSRTMKSRGWLICSSWPACSVRGQHRSRWRSGVSDSAGWVPWPAGRAARTHRGGVSRRYHQLWLLVELPALIDELAGRWHRGPDQTLSWLEQGMPSCLRPIGWPSPPCNRAICKHCCACWPCGFESTLPFPDKGAQGGGQFVE